MTKNKTKHSIKFSILSLIIAIAMLLSFNYSFAFSVANFATRSSYAAETEEDAEEKYSYKAEELKKYLFSENEFKTNNSDGSSINNGKAKLLVRQALYNDGSSVEDDKRTFIPDNKLYYPIVKYNGISLLKSERDAETDLPNKDTIDHYAGVISANEYRVVKKDYDGKYETVTKVSNIKVVYVVLAKASDTEAESVYNVRLEALQTKLAELNGKLLDYATARYVAKSVFDADYNDTNYIEIDKETEAYSDDILLETQNKVNNLNLEDYALCNKKIGEETFETVEKSTKINKIYIRFDKSSSTEEKPDYDARLALFQAKITALNNALAATYATARYYVQSVFAPNYDLEDFAEIKKTNEAYTTDIAPEIDGKVADLDLSQYSIFNKKTFEYKENSLYLQTQSSYKLNANSYYVVAAWVYTAGDAEASIEIAGTKFSAKYEQINTEGTWQRVYIFVGTPAQDNVDAKINLYYGDTYGVTGSQSLEYYRTGKFDGTDEDNYLNKTLIGTVVFDNISLYSISYTEFINQTINGHAPEDITPKYLAEGKTFDNITNSQKAILDGQGNVTGYQPAEYSTAASMTKKDYYLARYAKNTFASAFDQTFDTWEGKPTNEMVYADANLDYYTYERNTTLPFNYYVPRYDGTTTNYLTTADINDYRAKYASEDFAISVVAEENEFEAYEKIYYDELGNTEKTTGGEDRTDTVTNNTFANDNKILKIKNDTSFDLGLVTTAIAVPAHTYYRISVWVYSSDKEATATAKIFASIKTKNALEHGNLVISSGATATDFEYNSDSYNGWKEIKLFVQGNPTTTENVYLVLLASKNSTIYFDNIKVEACTSSAYTSITSSDRIDLASYGKLTSSITNGYFDNIVVDSEDALATYPYAPSDSSWTVVKDSSVSGYTTKGVVSGIISTKQSEYEKVIPARDEDGNIDYYGADEIPADPSTYLVDYAGKPIKTTTVKELFGNLASNPSTPDDQLSKNIYAVHMPEDSDFMLRSGSISFSSSKVYKLTFDVWFGDGFEGTFSAKLMSSSSSDAKTIAAIVIDEDTLISENMWQTFAIYVRTGATSQSLNLLFAAVESTGNVFIKDITYSTLSEITDGNVTTTVDELYNEAFDATNGHLDTVETGVSHIVRFVDFKNSNFVNHSKKADIDNKLYQAYGYSLETPASSATYQQGTLGVAELNEGFMYDNTLVAKDALNAHTKSSAALALVNYATGEKPQYTLANNAYSNTLSSGKYYKVTVDAFTSDMGTKGLSIIANGLDAKFENLTSKTGWTTYTFYFAIGKSSITNFSLSYALGEKDNSYAGWALVSNMQVEELTESKYNAATTAEGIDEDKTVVIKSLVKNEEDTDDEGSTAAKNNFSWQTFFLVFSSVLLVASLVVALVAVIIKRRHKKKPVLVESQENKNSAQGGIV